MFYSTFLNFFSITQHFKLSISIARWHLKYANDIQIQVLSKKLQREVQNQQMPWKLVEF